MAAVLTYESLENLDLTLDITVPRYYLIPGNANTR